MLVVKTSLKGISGKGIGLIAEEDIKKGTVVWTYNPLIDISIPKDKIPVEAEEFLDTYAVDRGKDSLCLSVDNARFINHSKNPNTKALDGSNGDNIAICDIKKGEEILIDYEFIDINKVDFQET